MQTVRIALLFSTSGVMEQAEKPLMLFGKYCLNLLKPLFEARELKLEIEEADYGSQLGTLLQKIKELERKECRVFFGPYTSLHRRAARQAMAPYSLMFYPVQYEGFDDEGPTWFFGGTPNQQLIPVIEWFRATAPTSGIEPPRVYFIGSDYEYPKMVRAFLREPAINRGLKLIKPQLHPLDDDRPVVDFVRFLHDSGPGLVVNAINGNANRTLFEEIQKFKAARDWPSNIRIVSLSLSDVELLQYSTAACEGSTGSYLAANCFDSQIAKLQHTDSKLAWVRLGFQKSLKGQRNIPPLLLSDAMVNLYAAIEFWSSLFLEGTRANPSCLFDVTAYLRRSAPLQGPSGTLEFRGAEKHGDKRFFLGELHNGRVRNVFEPFDLLYPAMPSLNGEVPPDSGIFELAKTIRDEARKTPPPCPSGTFHEKLANGQIRYEPDPGRLFEDFYPGCSVHRLSDIFAAGIGFISTPETKNAWRDRWLGLVIAIEKLNCVDADIKSALQAFRGIEECGAAELAFATCKLRAVYTRCIPKDPSKRRLYLMDLLDIALSRGASVKVGSAVVKEGSLLAAEMASIKALDFSWEQWKQIDNGSVAEILRAFTETNSSGKRDLDSVHYVSLCNDELQYQLELTMPSRLFPRLTADKIVFAEDHSGGNVASVVHRLRLLDPNLAAVVPPTIRVAGPSAFQKWNSAPPAERFCRAAPAYVYETQASETGVENEVKCLARLTIIFRRPRE